MVVELTSLGPSSLVLAEPSKTPSAEASPTTASLALLVPSSSLALLSLRPMAERSLEAEEEHLPTEVDKPERRECSLRLRLLRCEGEEQCLVEGEGEEEEGGEGRREWRWWRRVTRGAEEE